MSPSRIMPADRGLHHASQALIAGGYARTGMNVAWDISARCERPVNREMIIRDEPAADKLRGGSRVGYSWQPGQTGGWNVDYQLRCRQCGPCLRHRRGLWAMRARSEVLGGVRTWFGTITLSPQAHFQMLLRADSRLSRGGTVLDSLPDAEQFRERCRETGFEITKFLKRVRKNTGAPLRLLFVTEKHESGLPHFHCLLHESDASRPITYRQLANEWPHGFVKFKLVDEGDARAVYYVTKYLGKSADARVRASIDYGNPPHACLALGAVRSSPSGVGDNREKNDLPTTHVGDPTNAIGGT